MPVAQGGPTPARQAIFIGLGALLGLLAVVFLVTRLDQLGGDEDATVQVGDPIFSIGAAADVAEAIELQGPLLLPDAATSGFITLAPTPSGIGLPLRYARKTRRGTASPTGMALTRPSSTPATARSIRRMVKGLSNMPYLWTPKVI